MERRTARPTLLPVGRYDSALDTGSPAIHKFSVKRGDTLFVLFTERISRLTPETQAAAIDQLRQRRDSLKEDLSKQRRIAQIEIENPPYCTGT